MYRFQMFWKNQTVADNQILQYLAKKMTGMTLISLSMLTDLSSLSRICITYLRETLCALSTTGIVTGYWRASSEDSRPNWHDVSEGNYLNQESFIGGIPSESALRIRGKPSVLPQSLESWLDIEELHRRNPIRIGIPYLAYQMENPPSIKRLAGEDLCWFPILICHLTYFSYADLAGSAWGNNWLHNSIQINFKGQ